MGPVIAPRRELHEPVMNIRATASLIFACAACSCGTSGPGGSAAPPSSDEGALASSPAAAPAWTGTWAASPQSSGTTFNAQTLRQIVHTSIGGTAARIQISNVFGNQPLHVADVHIALRSS